MPGRRNRSTPPISGFLLRALDHSFNHRTWHGTNLHGSLRRLSPEQALWRPAPGRHNIWELVLRAAYWKYASRQRLVRGRRGQLPYKGSNWFPSPSRSLGAAGALDWKQVRSLLQQTHDALLEAVAQYPPVRLHKPVHGSKWSAFDTIFGVAYHDIYHAGQIQLLKRLQKA